MSWHAHIQRSPATDDVSILLYMHGSGPFAIPGTQIMRPAPNGAWECKLIEPGGLIPEDWWIKMPMELLQAIVAEATHVIPVSEAVDRHLKDALAIRDRLLAIVELHSGIGVSPGKPGNFPPQSPDRL